MAIDQKDLELIERIVYKSADDVAVSIARSFERLEERFDAMESRIYSRLADIEERVEVGEQNVRDEIRSVTEELK